MASGLGVLDLLVPYLCFKIQSAVFPRSFWTSSCFLSTSTSNLPHFLFPFGLQHTFTPLQRPIHRAFSSLLDFLIPFLCFNVQSTTLYPLVMSDSLWSIAKGSEEALASSLPFAMDQRGVEPLSENPFPVLLLS